jgi:hypothetical protein
MWIAFTLSYRLTTLNLQNGIASETFDLLYFFAANRVTGDNVNLPMSNQIKLAALQSLGMYDSQILASKRPIYYTNIRI